MMFLTPYKSRRANLWNDVFDFDFDPYTAQTFQAPVQIKEDDQSVSVKVELPGVEKNEINIDFKDGLLSISGEKRDEKTEEKQDRIYSEVRVGRFNRQVKVGQGVNYKDAKADLKNGVLSIDIPKLEESKPHRLQIK